MSMKILISFPTSNGLHSCSFANLGASQVKFKTDPQKETAKRDQRSRQITLDEKVALVTSKGSYTGGLSKVAEGIDVHTCPPES